MNTLLTRKELVETKKIIGSELTKLQREYFNESILEAYVADNEEHLYRDAFDFIEGEVLDIPTLSKAISLNHSEIKTFTAILAAKLLELYNAIGATEFYVLGHIKMDLFGNRANKFKPLADSYKKLERIVGKKTYDEAFHFDITHLRDFVEILFWLERCDPSVPEFIFLFDRDERTNIYLSKYGNVYLTEFEEETLTEERLRSMGWAIVDGEEFDNFSSDGRIGGRQIVL